MQKRFAYIAIAIIALMPLLLSGCYTIIATKKLTRKNWRKKHRYQYFSKTKWGKTWNTYYWSPSTKDFLGRSIHKKLEKTAKKKDEKKQSYPEPYYKPRRYHYSNDFDACVGGCVEGCTSSCLSDIFDSIFGNDNQNESDNDTIPPPDEQPRRRRGM